MPTADKMPRIADKIEKTADKMPRVADNNMKIADKISRTANSIMNRTCSKAVGGWNVNHPHFKRINIEKYFLDYLRL
ncbi:MULTISPECIES: hypothetical protein [Lysinibacillus]|uniref:hypothetical protein n=1 Tax=Lysinibacillus TaxID=400634 RepID=UPI001CBFA108|nr:hypothetical protein [Lysinibacillus sphaericus]